MTTDPDSVDGSVQFPLLLSPFQLGSLTLPNRVVLSAHVTNLADTDRHPSERVLAYYVERARGGTGLIMLESFAVHPTAGSSRLSMQAFDDAVVPGLRRVADAVHAENAYLFAQLNHGGREHNPLTTRHPLWSPSAIASKQRRETPHAMTIADIDELVAAFVAGALRLQSGGLDGVEINSGHGYLLHQFLTPIVNHRNDSYGGSLQNRARLAARVLTEVRAAVGPDFVVGVRLSGSEFLTGGIDSQMSSEIAQLLVAATQIDYVSVSMSTYETLDTVIPDMSFGQAPFVNLAHRVRDAIAPVPVITAGRISTPHTAEAVLANRDADLVAMTRAQIADPFLVRKIVEGRTAEIRPCIGCNQGCIGFTVLGGDISCLQNPAAGDELNQPGEEPPPAEVSRRVVVVGGGPAGMEAAWWAAAAGHRVTLFEAAQQLGGLLKLAESLSSRADVTGVRSFRETMLAKHSVDVRLGSWVGAAEIRAERPDVVILATGSVADPPADYGPGIRSMEWAFDDAGSSIGSCLVIDGEGTMTALTVAEQLAERGAQVTLSSAAGVPGNLVIGISLIPAQRRLAALGVRQLPLHSLVNAANGRAELRDALNGTVVQIAAEHVIPVAARRAVDELYDELVGSISQVLLAGDAMAPRQAIDAIRDGRRAAQRIR